MENRRKTTESIDQIGTKVLKAVRVQDHDLERIVSADWLFDPIRTAMGDQPTIAKNTLAIRASYAIWNWRTVPVFAALAFAALGAFYLIRPTPTETISYQLVPAIEFPEMIADIGSTEVAFVQTENNSDVPVRKHIPKQRSRAETEDVGEFQALTYTGDATDTTDGRIVRVELPRSSLFAMGVDLPVENQATNKVKADLLIGEDGVMRAVRIVN